MIVTVKERQREGYFSTYRDEKWWCVLKGKERRDVCEKYKTVGGGTEWMNERKKKEDDKENI
jgi:hypothetical protein